LGPINLIPHRNANGAVVISQGINADWVIAGGESGPHARPSHPDWFRAIVLQCRNAGVPFFMKQLGGYPDKKDDLEKFPSDLMVREVPS
jgi:Bacteriophage protein gp37